MIHDDGFKHWFQCYPFAHTFESILSRTHWFKIWITSCNSQGEAGFKATASFGCIYCRYCMYNWRLMLLNHHLSDPWTEQLSHLQLTVWTYATPELSPCSHLCAVVIGKAKQVVRLVLDVKNRSPSFSLLFCQKWNLILLSVLRRLLSVWPKPASELWYRVLLLFLWDN